MHCALCIVHVSMCMCVCHLLFAVVSASSCPSPVPNWVCAASCLQPCHAAPGVTIPWMFTAGAQSKRGGRAAAAAKPAFSITDMVKQAPRVYFASRTHSQLAQVRDAAG